MNQRLHPTAANHSTDDDVRTTLTIQNNAGGGSTISNPSNRLLAYNLIT